MCQHRNIKRARARWLEGAPPHVADCFRPSAKEWTWTVLFVSGAEHGEVYGLEASENPYHPQGVGLTFFLKPHEAAQYRYRNGHYRVRWQDLPELVRKCAESYA